MAKTNFNPTEECTVTFESADGKKKAVIKMVLDTATNLSQTSVDFDPKLEPGSKPEFYAALALMFVQKIAK